MLKGYRTIIWNVANAAIPVLELTREQGLIPDEWMPYWLLVYMAGNIALRLITTTPVGRDQ